MSALDTQEGGDHYKKLAIQPFEYIHRNGIGFAEGCAIKYLTRWKDKGGVQDLKKARHFIDLLIDEVERSKSLAAAKCYEMWGEDVLESISPTTKVHDS